MVTQTQNPWGHGAFLRDLPSLPENAVSFAHAPQRGLVAFIFAGYNLRQAMLCFCSNLRVALTQSKSPVGSGPTYPLLSVFSSYFLPLLAPNAWHTVYPQGLCTCHALCLICLYIYPGGSLPPLLCFLLGYISYALGSRWQDGFCHSAEPGVSWSPLGRSG